MAAGADLGSEPLAVLGGTGMPTAVDDILAGFGGACVVVLGTTVVLLEMGWLPAAGTSTTTEHLGQRAFLPAYLPSTLNFAVQAGQRHKTSDMVESLWK